MQAGHDLIREFDALYEDCITDARLAVEQVLGVSLAEPVEVEPLSTGCISVSNQTNATVSMCEVCACVRVCSAL